MCFGCCQGGISVTCFIRLGTYLEVANSVIERARGCKVFNRALLSALYDMLNALAQATPRSSAILMKSGSLVIKLMLSFDFA